MKNLGIKNYLLISALCIATTAGAGYLWHRNRQNRVCIDETQSTPAGPKKVRLNVFIHGSFGTTLSLLSALDVLKDTFRGSSYHHTARQMRQNAHFYKEQPILQRGLVPVTPTFDLDMTQGVKLAAYPIIKVYDDIHTMVFPDAEEQKYYTFGWTGFLGQKSRRYESIRLFNALSREIHKLREDNYEPSIRLICHSHGGNVALNLDLINTSLASGRGTKLAVTTFNEHRRTALENMHELLSTMTTREGVVHKLGQKQLDYYPEDGPLHIEELILFGTPLQPETDHCLVGDTFNNVYHFYSEQDMIQQLDWFSTKRGYSKKRLERRDVSAFGPDAHASNFTQAKIMVGREMQDGENVAIGNAGQPFWQQLLSDFGLLSKNTADPGHKELWFAQWDEKPNRNTIAPLPTVVLTPLFLSLLKKDPTLRDTDLLLTLDEKQVGASVIEHDTTKIKDSNGLSRETLDELTKLFLTWKPGQLSKEEEFEIVNNCKQEAQNAS